MAESSDVVVVGGGIAGVSTAYYLTQTGVPVTLIEKDSVGSHASGFAYGGLGSYGSSAVGGPAMTLASEGMRLHRQLAEVLPEETGINPEYRERSSLSLVFDEDEAEAAKAALPSKQTQGGYSVSWADAGALREIEPRISDAALGGVHVGGTADVEPHRLVLAIAQAAGRAGAKIRRGRVDGVSREGGGYCVSTDAGDVSCGSVVLAMGPWGGRATSWLGFPIAVRPLKGQILRLWAPGPPVRCSVGWDGNYATTKPDGLLWAGTTEEEAGFDEDPTKEARDQIMASLQKMLPSMAGVQIVRQTACLRPLSADGLPVLGEVPGWDGVYVATGAGRSGIVLGPAMGSVTAKLITTGEASIPIGPFEPGRFSSDG
jgi:glycine oxidase